MHWKVEDPNRDPAPERLTHEDEQYLTQMHNLQCFGHGADRLGYHIVPERFGRELRAYLPSQEWFAQRSGDRVVQKLLRLTVSAKLRGVKPGTDGPDLYSD